METPICNSFAVSASTEFADDYSEIYVPLEVARKLETALRNLYNVIRDRHYGRMPEEVKNAFDAAGSVLANDVHQDDNESEEYQRFVASMVQHCHCHERLSPCDGVLAGGICDWQTNDPRENDDLEYRLNPFEDDE